MTNNDDVKDNKSLSDTLLEVKSIQEAYLKDPKQKSFNLLLLGESGSGKTYLTRTCRFPVHIDSFDPGGTKGLTDYIKKGQIVVDSEFESEDPTNPKAYAAWKKKFEHRLKIGYFDHFGTYVLDSATTFADSIMNHILRIAGIPGQAPRFTKDYGPQKIELRNKLQKCLDLSCDFVLTGHLVSDKDEVTGRIKYKFMTTGKGDITIPLLFDEIWVMLAEAKGRSVEYNILTRKNGAYPAASRIGKENFETFEKPDVKAMLKKAGWNALDKPLLK